jgi:uncharacterized protein
MSKEKSKNAKRSKSRLFQIVVGIVLLAFIVLMLSDLFTKKAKDSSKIVKHEQERVYKFTKHGELTFQSSDRIYIDTIDIEFADNDYERSQGLMYRTEMEENQGMLFVFPYEESQSFFMKNTIISLDMIFINSNLEIVTIHKNTVPYSLESSASTAPAQYVLETIAGYTEKYNINVGDKVIFRKTN